MLLVPYAHRVTRPHLPLGVILLVIVNVAVYLFFQSADEKRYKNAFEYYAGSTLAEVEPQRYVAHLKAQGRSEDAALMGMALKERQLWPLLQTMERDEDFLKALRADEIIAPDEAQYSAWKMARQHFDKLRAAFFTERFMFKTNAPDWLTAITHQFLHGDLGHLAGNMLVLILIAPAVEALLGTSLFLGLYVASGLAAVGLHWGLHLDQESSLVGASGAIAGAMGMFAMLLGARRIPFFFFAFVYFDIIKARALFALPIWIINEVVQLVWLGNDNVAYGAHLGGLVAGALLVLPLKPLARRHIVSEEAAAAHAAGITTEADAELAKARRYLARQNFDEARRAYSRAMRHIGENDVTLLRECLNVISLSPQSDEYHRSVRPILDSRGGNSEWHRFVMEVYRTYLSKAKPLPKLGASTLTALCERCIEHRETVDLEKVARLLARIAPAAPTTQALLRRAAQALYQAGQPELAASVGNLAAAASA